MPVTTTGVWASVTVPLPSCPAVLAPHRLAVPLASNAHEWVPPAAIATALVRPVTTTGVWASGTVPVPSCPAVLAPQHLAVPLGRHAHQWVPPATIATPLVPPGTTPSRGA